MAKKIETSVVHAAQQKEPVTGAVIPPIFTTSTYALHGIDEKNDYEYSRSKNPTRLALENMLAQLEYGFGGLAFSSGMAAIAATLELLQPGDHVLVNEDIYAGTWRLFEQLKYKSSGLKFSYIDMRKDDIVATAVTSQTKMIWLETPSNPLLRIVDIKKLAAVAKRIGALVVVDNTFATPYIQQPLLLGADIVVHSLTKYLNGHSDVIGGALIAANEELYNKLKFVQNSIGAILGPFDSYLVLRGVKTLALRMKQHCENAAAIATWLEQHELVEQVFYPGLSSHPQRKLILTQMSNGFGGIISFKLKLTLEQIQKFLQACSLFTLAESLGGVESLIEHPAKMTHATLPTKLRQKLAIDNSLIRISVGIEDKSDLLQDLALALQQAL